MQERIALDYSLLERLTQAFGPSGREENIRNLIIAEVKDYCDEIISDKLGNLIIHKKGSGRKVLVAVHMDEIGTIITNVDENGYLRYSAVGGLRSNELNNARVRFENGNYGIIHKEADIYGEKKLEKYYIDAPASDNANESINYEIIGEMAVLFGPYYEAHNRIISKALDNRAGCFAAIEVLKQLNSQDDVYFAFTVQEEVGTRGAKIAAHSLEPDFAIVLDATIVMIIQTTKTVTIALELAAG